MSTVQKTSANVKQIEQLCAYIRQYRVYERAALLWLFDQNAYLDYGFRTFHEFAQAKLGMEQEERTTRRQIQWAGIERIVFGTTFTPDNNPPKAQILDAPNQLTSQQALLLASLNTPEKIRAVWQEYQVLVGMERNSADTTMGLKRIVHRVLNREISIEPVAIVAPPEPQEDIPTYDEEDVDPFDDSPNPPRVIGETLPVYEPRPYISPAEEEEPTPQVVIDGEEALHTLEVVRAWVIAGKGDSTETRRQIVAGVLQRLHDWILQ